jgi:TonB family protein
MRFQLPAALAALTLLTSAAGAQTAGIAIEDRAEQPGKLVRQVRPVYPAEAKEARITGKVRLEAVVAKDGKIQDLKIASGHPLLAAAAVEAVRQWEYAPVEKDGQPVAFKTQIDLNFTLADNGPAPLEVAGGVQAGKLVNKVNPVYPADAKQQGLQGMVRLRATIGTSGAVETLDVREGDPALASAAVEAVKQWQYSPTMVNGAAVAVIVDIDINFTLQ